MAYKIYGDGEIWKDGRKYGDIYSDGEIWRDGQLYAKVYEDGEIWQNGRKIGKIYDDGEVWIGNAKWGKIYSKEENSCSPSPIQNVSPGNDDIEFSTPTIPGVPDIGVSDSAVGAGIFAVGFFILFLVCSVAAVFVTGIDMWKEFTIGRIEEFGDAGAIAAGILIVGVIFGFVTQYTKFNGGFIAGLIMQSVIICVASLLGAVVVAGIESFTLEDMDPVVFFGMFIYMALFPSLLCKLIAVVANKLGWKSDSTKTETKKETTNTHQQKTPAANNSQAPRPATPAPQAVPTQRPAVYNPQTTRTPAYAPQVTNAQSAQNTRKSSRYEAAFDELNDFLEDKPLIVKILVYGLIIFVFVWFSYTLFTEGLFIE